jgi:hypothetical protein
MKLSPLTLSLALALLLAPAPEARADLIPWTYNWSRSPSVLHADAPGTSTIALTDEPLVSVVGDSDVVATNLKTFSQAPATNPDHFTHAAYTLLLTLTDSTSGKSGTLAFTGYIDGTLSMSNAHLTNTFTSTAPQTMLLGSTLFTATVDEFTHPGIPGSTTLGCISGHVMIKVETVVTILPEPSSLALSGLGLVVLGLARRRIAPGKWRRAVREQEDA